MSHATKTIGRGSSKDLFWSEGNPDHVSFEFSDRVSVFDYGALPEAIPGKGKALEACGHSFFAALAKDGIATAFDEQVSTREKKMYLHLAEHPKFRVEGAKPRLKFIPLEVIFRFGVPLGSSLLKRRKDLKPNARFEKPLIEFSTKLEAADRILDRTEAETLAGNSQVLVALETYATGVAYSLKNFLRSVGLELWDGKLECAVDPQTNEILMVDALTPDELRVTLPGLESIPLSKELLRMWMGRTNWAFRLREAKKSGHSDWKKDLLPPPKLGAWRQYKLSSLYESFATCLREGSSRALLDWVRSEAVSPKVFVSGAGGREAALRWKLRSEGAEITDVAGDADVVWISPDAELADGAVDRLEESRTFTYGPTKEAAKVEWSKSFGREIAAAAGIRIPKYSLDVTDLRKFSAPPVVKLDGLAAGKGVVVPNSWDEAEAAIEQWRARGPLLLEERLSGVEASAFFAVESGFYGTQCHYLGSAKDFKRRFPADVGPNTGGMGAYAPHPEVTKDDVALFSGWALATAQALDARKLPYNGILYMGLIRDPVQGWVLLEYNARMGDPETQSLCLMWPTQGPLRAMLQLDLRNVGAYSLDTETKALCLALVRPEYPEAVTSEIELPEWKLTNDKIKLFRSQSTKGRVAYLVAEDSSLQAAGDQIFESLIASPWSELLEWRADILK